MNPEQTILFPLGLSLMFNKQMIKAYISRKKLTILTTKKL